ncbi:MAG TPA: hypothetical protein VEZ11_17675 [Thermoanaerobaculia bacterium]|nr:hypothetical protein [Thermoanaerobaculia bacterium]
MTEALDASAPRRGLAMWWASLATSPEPLTPSERLAVALLSLLTAASRILALARTPWDWDEMLFSLALRRYSVLLHHPHPPGFPLFVLAAKAFNRAGFSAFHSLQAVNFVGAVLLFPALFFLARELRFRFVLAIVAALLFAFAPNVWFYGGTAFSDIPSIAAIVLAIALLLRGCRDDRAYLAGAVILAIATGIRAQNLVIGAAPALIATSFQWRRSVLRCVAALLLVAVIVAASYAGAVIATGSWAEYSYAVKLHQQYIAQTDSFRSPIRPPLLYLLDDFFFWPYRVLAINLPVALLAALSLIVSLVRRRGAILTMLASFGPFCLLAWLTLDHFSASRFSIGYAPLYALLAADGIDLLVSRIPRRDIVAGIAGAGLAGLMIVWTLPSLKQVRTAVSPPVAAMDWIRNNLDRSKTMLFVHEGMEPYSDWFLPDYRRRTVERAEPVPMSLSSQQQQWHVEEDLIQVPGTKLFTWPRTRLWRLARQRYFEVSIVPVRELLDFREGWYEKEEESVGHIWRWMGARSVTILPPRPGHARLYMVFYFPLDALKIPPMITVTVDDHVIDRFVANKSDMARSYEVPGNGIQPLTLVLSTDRTVNPARAHLGGDDRDLGLRLSQIEWR